LRARQAAQRGNVVDVPSPEQITFRYSRPARRVPAQIIPISAQQHQHPEEGERR
jgi:hypothetical protein